MNSPYTLNKTHVIWIVILVLSFWAILLNHIKRIEKDEMLYLLIESNVVNEDKLKDDLLIMLKDDGIRKINMTVVSEDSPYFGQTLLTSGLFEADILILNGALISTFSLEGTFKALNDFNDISSINDERLLIQDEKIYGIEISSQFSSSYHLMHDEKLYVFFNVSSVHSSDVLYKTIELFVKNN